jgi:uncharacterized protein GlcG (DUF336 family)
MMVVVDAADLSGERARSMIDAAISHAQQLGVTVSVAVVDRSGNLVALQRMDGAMFISPEIGWGKAWTSAAFRAPSGAVAENLSPAPGFVSGIASATHGRFMPRQGAIPLPDGGAIGASGASSGQDEEIARAGLAATA